MADSNTEVPQMPKFEGGPEVEPEVEPSAADKVKEAGEAAAAKAREAAARASEAAEPAVKAAREAAARASEAAEPAVKAAQEAAAKASQAMNEASDAAAVKFRTAAAAAEAAAAPAAEAAHRVVKDVEARAQETFGRASAAAEPHIKAAQEAAEAASIRAREAAAAAAEAAEPAVKAAREASEAAAKKAAELSETAAAATREATEVASAKAAEMAEKAREASEVAKAKAQEAAAVAMLKAGEVAEATKQGLNYAGSQLDNWDAYAEYYVPSGSFGKGPKAERTLRFSRKILFGLYQIVGFLLFAMLLSFIIGWFEIGESIVKYGELEAPSVAVCPWGAVSAVVNNPKSTYEMYAVKYTPEGHLRLPVTSEVCEYDRKCSCLDLRSILLQDMDRPHVGITGLPSKQDVNFREHVVIHTTLTDPSIAQTLKVGLYNSEDARPTWLYAPQFRTTIGSLRLESIQFTVMPWNRLWGYLTGARPRDVESHYVFTGNVVDTSSERDMDLQQFTRISLEYENFYVKKTNVAAWSTSLYGTVMIALLALAFLNVFSIWESMFPMGKSGTRGVADGMKWFSLEVLGQDLDAEDVIDPEKPIVADSDEAVKGKTYGTA